MQGADIDNRLKTLFDALRYPEKDQEVPSEWQPNAAEGEVPMFCLLEDHRLVTRVQVAADRLLAPETPDEVALTIRVQLRTVSPTLASMALLG